MKKYLLSLPVMALAVCPLQAAQANDFDALGVLLEGVACGVIVDELAQNLASSSLYVFAGGDCTAIAADDASNADTLYADSNCAGEQVNFSSLSTAQFCTEISDKAVFGNDASIDEAWRQPPWPTLDTGVISIKGNKQPYETRRIYSTPVDDCALEMHIFKQSVGAQNLKPLLLIHGGSWKYRQSGAFGLMTQISHYTQAGFTVFSPFYRLTGENESAAACSNALGEDIVKDIDTAYQWVQGNAETFGADGSKIFVAGQSAGAHLAARMAVEHPNTTGAALLLYPPTDFQYFLGQYKGGLLESKDGVAALEGFIGQPLDDISLNDDVVLKNSLPNRVAEAPDSFPPMFMIHGGADTLVPVDQSVRLCNAFSGNVATGATVQTGANADARQSFDCGNESRLEVVTAANHVLDFCVEISTPLAIVTGTSADKFCPTGGAAGKAAAAKSLAAGLAWLEEEAEEVLVSTPSEGSSGERGVEGDTAARSDSGGGSTGFLSLAALLAAYRRQKSPSIVQKT